MTGTCYNFEMQEFFSSFCVARVCQHQLGFLVSFRNIINTQIHKLYIHNITEHIGFGNQLCFRLRKVGLFRRFVCHSHKMKRHLVIATDHASEVQAASRQLKCAARVWAWQHCRSPPRFLAECRMRRLNQGSFVLLFFGVVCFSGLSL